MSPTPLNRHIAKVLWNRPVTPEVFLIGLSCQTGYSHCTPGQFVMVRPVDQVSPLLSRPFSVYSMVRNKGEIIGIELLVKVVGKGTDQLANLEEGALVSLLGPLGNGFDIHYDDDRAFLVAGGVGVAPLVFLAETMVAHGFPAQHCELFIGGQSSTDLLGIDQLTHLNVPVHLVTEDGSRGKKGRVTSGLTEIIRQRRPDRMYVCGPWAMLAALADIAETEQIPCQVSIETMMGCGMGACLSCVVNTRDPDTPYRHACTDGPVMDSHLIKF